MRNYRYGQGLASLDPAILEGGSGSNLAWQSLTEDVVFGPKGWRNEFYPRVRKDLYFPLDDGYYAANAALIWGCRIDYVPVMAYQSREGVPVAAAHPLHQSPVALFVVFRPQPRLLHARALSRALWIMTQKKGGSNH